jgi:hypothetical protein
MATSVGFKSPPLQSPNFIDHNWMNYLKLFVPSIPSPPLCFYSSFFTKKKNLFSLEFSESYQGARLNFKTTSKWKLKESTNFMPQKVKALHLPRTVIYKF